MRVPLLDVKQQTSALAPELRAAFERVLASGQFILGREVEAFEQSLAAKTGARHAIGVSSGTDAILLALMSLDIQAGDEVICPAFTFFATAGCVARLGARPVFADCCPGCFNLNLSDAARRITPRTRAILPVHLYGQPAEMDSVMEFAHARSLPVIEDAAQAIGAAYRGRPAGSIGDMGIFSFYPSKNLGGFGDSGLLVANNDALAQKARLLREHGAMPKYFHQFVGGNFRMDPLQAALLGVKLAHLDEYTHHRQANARYYTERLLQSTGVAPTFQTACACHTSQPEPDWSAQGVRLLVPAANPAGTHIWNQYTLRVLADPLWTGSLSPRDALRDFLRQRAIGTELYYPLPLHLQECFATSRPPGSLPVSERLARECLSIPVYPELTREQQDYVVDSIAEFLASTRLRSAAASLARPAHGNPPL